MTYTITAHWKPSKHTDLDEPGTETAPDWPTARTKALKLTTLRSTAAVTVHDPDGELIANWDHYSNLWREPRPQPTIDSKVVPRARVLAAEYRDNPTPARAHNAAQALGTVLDTLEATIARTFTITDENDRLKTAQRPAQCCHFGGEFPSFTDADKPTTQQINALILKNMGPITQPLCLVSGPTIGAYVLTCFLARDHKGDHSTNAFPNPRTWPPLATGGIVDPTATHRIGE